MKGQLLLSSQSFLNRKPATQLDSYKQASYLKVWVTVGMKLELRLPAQLMEVGSVPRWLDLLGN